MREFIENSISIFFGVLGIFLIIAISIFTLNEFKEEVETYDFVCEYTNDTVYYSDYEEPFECEKWNNGEWILENMVI